MFMHLVAPQVFWWRHIRRHIGWTAGICLLINLGVYFERLAGLVDAATSNGIPEF